MKNLYSITLFLVCLLGNAQVSPVCFNSLIAANYFTVGSLPAHMCHADFDSDGNLDVAVVNFNSYNVSVLMGLGTGSFATAVNYSVGSSPWDICTADFNNDGKADLAVTNMNSNNVSVLMGSGTGTFSAAVNYSTGIAGYAIRTIDFNGDTYADLVLTHSGFVGVMLGSATGTFGTLQSYSAGTNPYALCTSDFNHDGKADVAVANNSSGSISVFLGTSSGTLGTAVNYTIGGNPYAVDFADFNSDNNIDLCVSSSGSGTVTVLFGTASGSFSGTTSYSIGTQLYDLMARDFNNDGFYDMAITKANARTICLLLGNGSGSFANPIEYLSTDLTYFFDAADFNNDGNLDIMHSCYTTPGNRVTLMLGSNSGGLMASSVLSVGATPFYLQSADFNGDGKFDFASANWGSNDISVIIAASNSNITYSAAVNYSVGNKPYALTAADFNNDGNKDLAVCNFSSSSVSLLLGSSTGTFSAATSLTVSNTPYNIISDDFNSDGNKDLAITHFNSTLVSVLFGNGTGSFSAATTYTASSAPYYIASGDVNGDGHKDLAYTNSGGNVVLLIGSASGAFTYGNTYGVGSVPYGIAMNDFNGDLKQDVVVANFNSNSVSVLLGSGAATFTSTTNFNVGTNPMSVVSEDLNMDGFIDLVVSNYNAANIGVLLGTGTGSFLSQYTLAVGANPRSLVSKDFNMDGKPDLALVNMSNNNINLMYATVPTLSITSLNSICLGNSISIAVNGANTYTWNTGANSNPLLVSPTVSTTYTVIGRSFGGCTATAVKSITVNVLPLPTVTVNSGTLCVGQTFTINPSGADMYSISGGAAIVSPTVTKTYTIVGTTTLTGCYSNPVTSSITVYSLPTITVNSGSICAGQTFTLVGSGAISYNFPGGTAVQSPTTNTTFSITGNSSQGCVSNPAYANISVYPRPNISVNNGNICAGQTFIISPSGAVSYTYSSGSVFVSPLVTTSYSIMGINTYGCESDVPAICIVSVQSVPTLSINGNNAVCLGSNISLLASGTAVSYSWSTGANTNLITLTPTLTSVYTLQGTGANSCQASITKTIVVHNLPTVSAFANSTLICSGLQLTLNGGGASTYNWTGGATNNLPFPAVSSNMYSVIGTDGNGCTNSASISIQVLPSPTINVISINPKICAGESTTLSVSGANSYTWSPNTTGAFLTISPLVSSIYTVTGSDTNGCLTSAFITQNVDACTGLSNQSGVEVNMSVYPNPSNGEFSIDSYQDSEITIVNALGQFILHKNLEQGKNKLDLTNYATGVYFIQFKGIHSNESIKLIKE